MKEVIVKTYQFSELSDDAKQHAYEWMLNAGWGQNAYYNENINSLKEFADIFPIKLNGREWTNFEFYANGDIESLSGQRLANYIWNNYRYSLYKGKYYSTKMKPCPVTKEHPAGLTYKYRHSKIMLEHSCVLTGFHMDDEILDPIYNFLDKPDNTTFIELMQECIDAWQKAVKEDDEYAGSFENMSEHAEINEYDFTEDGELFN